MAVINLTIPDAVLPRVVAALTADYPVILENGSPNPMTKAQYAKFKLIQFIRNEVKAFEQNAVMKTFTDSINNDITIT